MRPPKLIKPYVDTFVRQATRGRGGAPLYVPCDPAKGAPYNECFAIVESRVAAHGGESLVGWAIWERPKLWIEAELHTVWKRADGFLVDIAARPEPIRRILFVHDPGRRHAGVQVNNVRKALTKDKDVHRFLALADARFRLMNEGDRKHQFGEIEATPDLLANLKEGATLEAKIIQRYGPWGVED